MLLSITRVEESVPYLVIMGLLLAFFVIGMIMFAIEESRRHKKQDQEKWQRMLNAAAVQKERAEFMSKLRLEDDETSKGNSALPHFHHCVEDNQ